VGAGESGAGAKTGELSMRFIFTFSISVLMGLGIFSCSSDTEKPVKKETVSARTRNAVPATATNSTVPANVADSGNDVVPPETAGNITKRKLGPRNRQGENTAPSSLDLEAELKRSAKPAAENSEFGAVLTDVLFERRTFKSHPLLLRVEKLTKGQEKKIKVYLKDGRTLELAGDKIDFISTASSSDILKAAGVELPAAARDTRSKTSQ
jgi:hypothetical protein